MIEKKRLKQLIKQKAVIYIHSIHADIKLNRKNYIAKASGYFYFYFQGDLRCCSLESLYEIVDYQKNLIVKKDREIQRLQDLIDELDSEIYHIFEKLGLTPANLKGNMHNFYLQALDEIKIREDALRLASNYAANSNSTYELEYFMNEARRIQKGHVKNKR